MEIIKHQFLLLHVLANIENRSSYSPCIMCVQYIGGCLVHRWGGGGVQYIGRYHEYIRGYHEYIRVCSVHRVIS